MSFACVPQAPAAPKNRTEFHPPACSGAVCFSRRRARRECLRPSHWRCSKIETEEDRGKKKKKKTWITEQPLPTICLSDLTRRHEAIPASSPRALLKPSPAIYTSHTFRHSCDFSTPTEICCVDIVCCQKAGATGREKKKKKHAHTLSLLL